MKSKLDVARFGACEVGATLALIMPRRRQSGQVAAAVRGRQKTYNAKPSVEVIASR
jgi:hypothetical protein